MIRCKTGNAENEPKKVNNNYFLLASRDERVSRKKGVNLTIIK